MSSIPLHKMCGSSNCGKGKVSHLEVSIFDFHKRDAAVESILFLICLVHARFSLHLV